MKNSLILISIFLLTAQIFAQPTASFDINPTSNFCRNDTIYFKNNSSNYVVAYWEFGDGTYTWTDNPFHIYTTVGDYTITLIVYDSLGNSDTSTAQITINPRPELQLINIQSENKLIARVQDPNNTSFRWYFNNTLTNETDSIVYYYESGLYAVAATNQFQCTDSQSIYINLDQNQTLATDTLQIRVLNNILTPNGDGINDVLFIQNLSTFPAPCQVLIYNQWGILVYRNDNYSNVGGFDGRDMNGKPLPAGTYYYIIRSQGKKTATGFIDIIR